MSVTDKFNDERERGLIEMFSQLEEKMGRELSDNEKTLMRSIYEFSFTHGVVTGTNLMIEEVKNTGKDDHES